MLTARSAFDDQSTCPLLNAHTATITRKIEPEPHWGIEDYNAGREIKIEIRQNKYLNNLIEVRHEVAYRSCSPFSPHRRSEPSVSPGESRSLNQERL